MTHLRGVISQIQLLNEVIKSDAGPKSNEEQQRVVVAATESVVTFITTMKSILIYNAGPNNVYYSHQTGVTTANFLIPNDAVIVIDVLKQNLYFICAAAETATLHLLGEY